MKEYKRKSTIYKNTTDCPKLSKKLRRIFEKSNRSQSKSELRNVDVEELFEDDDELEMELSWLCYKAERELGDKYECTCPDVRDEEAVREHMNYLNGLLLRSVMIDRINDDVEFNKAIDKLIDEDNQLIKKLQLLEDQETPKEFKPEISEALDKFLNEVGWDDETK